MKIISANNGLRVLFYSLVLASLPVSALARAHASPRSGAAAFQQAITGTVSDGSGPLAGATVMVKGTTRAVISDAEGKFSIIAAPDEMLIFSFTGLITIEVAVGAEHVLDIVLQPDVTQLEEVVVNAGYYSVKQKETTGSISRISSKDIETQPVTNVLATMQGRMAGVNIVQESGIAGSGYTITVRGLNSLRENANAPLFIIDGVPYSSDPISDRNTSTSIPGDGNPLNSINPADIENIEILKDADATAIYGSRGANGVVLITTKKGKAGKTTFTIDANHSAAKVTRMMDLMYTPDYIAMRQQAFANDGITQYPSNAYDVNGTWDPTRYTDWQKELLGGTAEVMALQASLSGGSEQTHYLLSGNYRTESSVFPGGSEYRKGGARLSFDHTSADRKFKVTFSGSYMAQNNRLPSIDFVALSRQLAPNAPALYDEQGNLNWENGTWENPLSNLESKYKSLTTDLIANAQVSYQILKGLAFKTSLGFTDLHNDETRAIPSTMYNPAFNLDSRYSSINFNTVGRKSWIIEPQLDWQKEFGNSKIDILVGTTFQNQESTKLSTLASGFSSNSLLYDQSAASRIVIRGNPEVLYKYQAIFGRANYSYLGRYILNLTGRRDGSSRFGPGRQFANFGAVGAAWLFYKENFISDNLPFLSFGKLRGSYGVTGNDQIGDYEFLDTYISSGSQYGGINGLQPARLYNQDFGWETNKKFEAALEAGFLQDRIFLTTAWYRNRSSNQLVGLPLPGTTGFSSIQANLDATVQNTGFEVTLRSVNFKSPDFEWVTSFNISVAGNKLLSFPGLEQSGYRGQYVVGQPTTIRKLFHFTGVDPQTGSYTFEDVNGDGVISYEKDCETIRDFNPDYYGGLQNQITYKGFQLDFLFQFVKQENFTLANTQKFAGIFSNQPTAYSNSWQQPGDIAPYQRYTSGANQEVMQASEYFALSDGAVGNASFIRLKNISLSYVIPPAWLQGVACRLSVQAQNLLTITPYKGADPEFTQGGSLPPMRVISAGVQLTF